ncbi:putative membrane protein [Enterococcus faecalis D32]|nr:putative membrane protein [Enterococcus faecalis D32]
MNEWIISISQNKVILIQLNSLFIGDKVVFSQFLFYF